MRAKNKLGVESQEAHFCLWPPLLLLYIVSLLLGGGKKLYIGEQLPFKHPIENEVLWMKKIQVLLLGLLGLAVLFIVSCAPAGEGGEQAIAGEAISLSCTDRTVTSCTESSGGSSITVRSGTSTRTSTLTDDCSGTIARDYSCVSGVSGPRQRLCRTQCESTENCVGGRCVLICGNGIVNRGETCATCPTDVPCATGQVCEAGACVVACGNGVIDIGEQCDGTNLAGQDCLGFASISGGSFTRGTLACNSECRFDTSGCERIVCGCGNRIRELSEECDDGNLINDDECTNDCDLRIPPACNNGICETYENDQSAPDYCPNDCGCVTLSAPPSRCYNATMATITIDGVDVHTACLCASGACQPPPAIGIGASTCLDATTLYHRTYGTSTLTSYGGLVGGFSTTCPYGCADGACLPPSGSTSCTAELYYGTNICLSESTRAIIYTDCTTARVASCPYGCTGAGVCNPPTGSSSCTPGYFCGSGNAQLLLNSDCSVYYRGSCLYGCAAGECITSTTGCIGETMPYGEAMPYDYSPPYVCSSANTRHILTTECRYRYGEYCYGGCTDTDGSGPTPAVCS